MPNNACEASTDYNFGHCVERSLIRKVGCQPPWSRVVVENVSVCDNKTLVAKYRNMYFQFGSLEREDLIKHTNCFLPCSYMEYKVSSKSLTLLILSNNY